VSTATLAQQNLVAAFRDLEHAEEGLAALHAAGFSDDELSLLGQPIEEVDFDERGPGEPIGGQVGKHIATGGVVGGAAGGVLGALTTAAVVSIPGIGMVAATGALLGALGGGGAGATVGAILEGESAMRSDHSWTQAFDAIKEGAIVVGVHGDDPDRMARATQVLETVTPMDLRRINSRGETVDPALGP
jgi:hypothetical protein